MGYDLDTATTEGRLVVADKVVPLDGDRYTLEGSARGIGVLELVPDHFVIGGASFNLIVYGYGFSPDSVINLAGNDERTGYIGPQATSTFFDASLWTNPDPAIPLKVTDPTTGESNTVLFAVLEP